MDTLDPSAGARRELHASPSRPDDPTRARGVCTQALRKQLFELMAQRINLDDSAGAALTGSELARSFEGGLTSVMPGESGWPPPMDTQAEAQAALLTALVWLIGKGIELQADENAAAAAALAAAKRAGSRR
jgi:hypothetical protein